MEKKKQPSRRQKDILDALAKDDLNVIAYCTYIFKSAKLITTSGVTIAIPLSTFNALRSNNFIKELRQVDQWKKEYIAA